MPDEDPIPIEPENPDREGDLAVEERRETKVPRRFKVLLHNDDYTTMEFVVDLLARTFNKTSAEAPEAPENKDNAADRALRAADDRADAAQAEVSSRDR